MADRYISREWLLEELGKYKDIREKWSTKVCDPDTILRVLHVMENLVNIAPNIGPIQYGNKKLEVKNAALKSELEHLKRQRQHDNENYIMAESVNNIMLMGFYKGRVQVEEQVTDWLERIVKDD